MCIRDRVRAEHPTAQVVTVAHRTRFDGAHARNAGAAAVDGDGLVCFLDADVVAAPELSKELLAHHAEGAFLVPDEEGAGLSTALVCSRTAFERVGGFDEAMLGCGEEAADLRTALSRAGLTRRTFPASLLTHRVRDAASAPDPPAAVQRRWTRTTHAAYRLSLIHI